VELSRVENAPFDEYIKQLSKDNPGLIHDQTIAQLRSYHDTTFESKFTIYPLLKPNDKQYAMGGFLANIMSTESSKRERAIC
jgi:hypothetical protein